VELFRPRRDKVNAPSIKEPEAPVKEPEPPESIEDIWAPAAQVATVGIFVLLFVAALYMCRPVLLPVVAAMVVGTTLAPIVKGAARHRISPWVTAIALGVVLVAAAALAVTLLAQPVSEWITKAPDIGAAIRQKLYVLDRPLAALRELQEVLRPSAVNQVAIEPSQWGVVTPVIAAVTPAVVEITLFFVTLIFFLATQMDFRRFMVSFFATRNGKLRFIRITNDLESYLASYVAIVTVINFGLGVVVAIGAWLLGLPNPILFGMLAMALNYIPYIGAACMTLVLLAVSLVSFPSLGYALLPPAAFVAVATIEGQFITPTVLGRSLTLNPLVVLLALAFWAWLWGPMGAFLAVPLTIVALVVLHHLFPPDEDRLPT
jgi:predicted PurR-regulated permease PerM